MSVKLLSTTGLQTLYGSLTNDTTTTHLDRGLDYMNTEYLDTVSSYDWFFLEDLYTTVTVADQQAYNLPANTNKVKSVSIDVSTTRYNCKPVQDWTFWEQLNQATTWESSYPQYYFVYNNTVSFWPVPAVSDYTIRIVYTKEAVPLSIADYTTGTITTATLGDETIVGSGTTFTAQMVNFGLVITGTATANTGDNRMYEIASVTNTTNLELKRKYLGNSIAAGSATFTIGQIPVLPQEYAPMMAYKAAYQFWATQDNGQQRAANMLNMYDRLKERLIEAQNQRTSQVAIEPPPDDMIFKNPNLYIQL